MLRYLARRLLYVVSTLLLIMLLTFFISIHTPGDPVAQQLRSGQQSGATNATDYWSNYERQRQQMGLHLPVFYFSFTRLAVPDTFHRIPIPAHREMLHTLVWEYGHWGKTQIYFHELKRFYQAAHREQIPEARKQGYQLLTANSWESINEKIHRLQQQFYPKLETQQKAVLTAFHNLESRATPWKNYLPALHWHGRSNQFHQWLTGDGKSHSGIIGGDLGQSYRTQRPVTEQLGEAIGVTVQLTLISLLLAFLIAIPLGVISAARQDEPLDTGISASLFVLHGMPAFWIGTLMIIFLGGGDFLDWFPPYGLGNIEGLSFWKALQVRSAHLAMPIFCLVYPILAYLSRQARSGVVNALHQPFITTARAKGMPEHRVVWHHGLRNALLPIITLLGNMLPFAIGGAVIVEVVFSIPGMGKVSLEALYARDYPVVFGAVLITSFFTILGYLVADLLYAVVDPRVRYKKKEP